MILKCLLSVLSLTLSYKAFSQEFSMGEYRKVFDLIKSDSALTKKYCRSNSLRLAVHSKFEYFPISTFENYLSQQGIAPKDLKRLKKLDRKQKRNQNLLTYKNMTDEFYSGLSLDPLPCAIVCFDRLKEFIIIAQVTTFGTGLDWQKLSLNKTIDVLIFDLSKTPYAYKRVTLIQ